MSKRPQIHIFVGAPSIPSPLEMLEQSNSAPTAEKWRERQGQDGGALWAGGARSGKQLRGGEGE